jgi:hypothetical protein
MPRVIGALSPTVLSPSPISTSQAALLLFAPFRLTVRVNGRMC